MQVSIDDGRLFYKLYAALLSFVNGKLNVVPEPFLDSREYTALPPETRLAVRNALYKRRELIDAFVQVNPTSLADDELSIVARWNHAIVGQFYIFRYLSKHAIFLTSDSPKKAYGVLGLADPFEDLVGPYLPRLIEAVLLPFKDRIIYDGLLSGYNITFGGGIKRRFNEEYRQAKETFGVITSLPFEGQKPPMTEESEAALPKKPKKSKTRPLKATSLGDRSASSTEVQTTLATLIDMTDSFCKEFLSEEYADLCRKLATALARKRPSPLLRGRLETWACGIVRTIGWVNYLDDRSQKPHLKLPFIDRTFGVAESTGQGKSKAIRTMFKIRNFDLKWTLPSRMDENPVAWMFEVNGFLMDIRNAPREVQEVALQRGLIPYIPADRAEAGGKPP
jgi:hypothetical protein